MIKENNYENSEFDIKDNVLFIEGCSSEKLVKQYGTPLFVYSKGIINKKCQELKDSFINVYDNTRVAYAAKAFLTIEMCRIIKSYGFCLDVVSGGELFIALKSGFPSEKIEFNGNNKLDDELEMAIEHNIGRIIVDSISELDRIERICKTKNKKVNVLYRITPGVDIDTHDYVKTGKRDSKFGIPIEENIFFSYVKRAIESDYVHFLGFHFHIGSQLHDNRPYIIALNIVLKISEEIMKRYNYVIKEINIGGGFGIKYNKDDIVRPYSYFFDPIMKQVKDFTASHNIEQPAIVVEPGRSIIGEAGITLYTIGNIKEIKGIRTYLAVDGGMTDNIRPALYGSKYNCIIADNASGIKDTKYTICGKCCESGDILIKDAILPKANVGNLIAVFSTGAYCMTMSSNYNKLLKPAVIMIENEQSKLIVKRQTYEELIADEV